MDKLFDTSITPASAREWALFGMRWATPIGLGLYAVSALQNNTLTNAESGMIAMVAIIATVSNLVILLLLLTDRWSRILVLFSVGLDVILAIAAMAVSSPAVGWVGVVPAVVAGLYFGWIPGVVAGGVVAIGTLVAQFVPQ